MRIRALFVAGICALTLLPAFSHAMGLGVHLPAGKPGHASPARGPAHYLVLFVLDGARPDYFGLTHLPHVDALRNNGTQFTNAIDGILESETPAGHTTIATGSPPSRNGILGFNWMKNDRDYSLFSPTVIQSGEMERVMSNAKDPTIAGLYKARFRGDRVVALSGHKYYAADPLGGPVADAIMYFQGDNHGRYVPVAVPRHIPPAAVLRTPGLTWKNTHLPPGIDDELADKLVVASFRVMRPHVMLVNEPEFDWPLGHVLGGQLNRARTVQLMQVFDRGLGMIEDAYRKAGVLNKTLFVITSDHGMAPLKRFISSDVITNAVSHAGTTAPSIAYNQSAYVWLKDATKAQAVAQNIVSAKDPGVKSVYYLTGSGTSQKYVRAANTWVTSGTEAANQYLLSTLMNGHQPTVVVFSKTWATFSSSTSHWLADHGGATWQSQHIPLILSGPGVRRHRVIKATAQLEDIAPTVLADLGVRPTGMLGHILTDALLQSSRPDRQARGKEIAHLNPMIPALIAQDSYEQNH